VEGFSTFVPFSIGLHVTNFIREQFWGRAARASLTRKSRGACFIFGSSSHCIFPHCFHSSPLEKRMTQALRLGDNLR
jgi:hypothetical protein